MSMLTLLTAVTTDPKRVVTALLGADSGNSTQRLAACESLPLPPAFLQYLNTSFLGQRQHVEAGPVNFTYYKFGPLNLQAKGTLCSKPRCKKIINLLS